MLGAMIGDMIGSPYEHNRNNIKTTDFPLFSEYSRFTDDTVMTCAVAEALMKCYGGSKEEIRAQLIQSMQMMGREYPDAGYGGGFYRWIFEADPQPYNSYGNGSAMRVSPVGWLYSTMDETLDMAKLTAEVTHDHPEGIKGAQAVAAAIYLARCGVPKAGIKVYVESSFGYDLSTPLDAIRPSYQMDVSCQGSVPQAIRAFLEGTDFETVIRLAVSIGGDSDTIAAIAGSIAEAFYGIPAELEQTAMERLNDCGGRFLLRYAQVFREFRRMHSTEPQEDWSGLVPEPAEEPVEAPAEEPAEAELTEAQQEEASELSESEQNEDYLAIGTDAFRQGDWEAAVFYFQKAAEEGNVTALSRLGECYYDGCGVPENREKAKDYWEEAAILGDAGAVYRLGDLYRNGELPVDERRSKAYYHRAYQLCWGSRDANGYPDVCLRLVKHCREDFAPEEVQLLCQHAIEGFEERIKTCEDACTVAALEEAKALLEAESVETETESE